MRLDAKARRYELLFSSASEAVGRAVELELSAGDPGGAHPPAAGRHPLRTAAGGPGGAAAAAHALGEQHAPLTQQGGGIKRFIQPLL